MGAQFAIATKSGIYPEIEKKLFHLCGLGFTQPIRKGREILSYDEMRTIRHANFRSFREVLHRADRIDALYP